MAKQILDEIDLFPMQEKLLEELLKPYELVPNALTTVAESVLTEPLTVADIQAAQEQFFPATDDEGYTGYTSDEIMDTGLIYAPYIPIYISPSVNVSDLKKTRYIYKIPKYNDIYSDIKERFEILDL